MSPKLPKASPNPGWKYRPLRRVGGGSSSEVWEARTGEGTIVALKVGRHLSERTRLANEAERLVWVDSPRLPAVLDAGFVPEQEAEGPAAAMPYVALAWAPGTAIDSQAPSEQTALRVARDVAGALADLHELGSTHGDVKPANVVVHDATARLVDLGLGGDTAGATPRGGTPRYLAPEVSSLVRGGDGRARDMWALGLTLAEVADRSNSTNDAARVLEWASARHDALGAIVRALLSPTPASRPTAEWVRRRALSALGESDDEEHTADRNVRRVKRAYLATRRAEILSAARRSRGRVKVEGTAGQWLEESIAIAGRIAKLRGATLDEERYELGPMRELDRARWLVGLVGATAASWPTFDLDAEEAAVDSALADRLLELARAREPITLADITARHPNPATRCPETAVELALALGAGAASSEVIDAAERAVRRDDAEPALAIALGRALRLRGELGRALAVLDEVDSVEARLEAAEAARRAGDEARAEELLDIELGAEVSPSMRARACGTRSRLLLDRGRAEPALALARDAPETAASLESATLAELALGNRREARVTLERACALAVNDEQRARLDAVAGTVAHADGDPELAMRRFESAAEHAARAGAVLEEATYLTGLAAAASDLGGLGVALDAARRSTLLFEHLGRPAEAARAMLNRATVFAIVGVESETVDAANDAIARARAAGDGVCEAYAHLAISDARTADKNALDHAERARTLLEPCGSGERLFAEARLLRRGGVVDVAEGDRVGRDTATPTAARLDWWRARAVRAALPSAESRTDEIIAQLTAMASATAPVGSKGPAMASGAELAANLGDGESARRLAVAAGEAARELVRRCPEYLQARLSALDWVTGPSPSRESAVSIEQIAQIDTLVRALGSSDRLKPLLDQVLDALVLWTGVERGLLLLRAPGGRLVPRAARNLSRDDLVGAQRDLSHSLAERALDAGQPVVAVDAAGELPEVHASVHELKLRSVLAVPLQARGESLGVVYLDDRVRRGAFGPRELGWVRLVASIAAIAIVEARDRLLLRRAARRAVRAERRVADVLATREAQLDLAQRELARARDGRETRFSYEKIIGKSAAVAKMLQVVDRVTVADVPVLLQGESGSGKELIARAIHNNGPRQEQPFVAENCSAIPEGLLESTLFGHVRGAFTGAARPRAGLFEVADQGTLFLDEIAEMSLGMQSKLLRVLEDGAIRPVGSERERQVDVRVVGATHRNLEEMVEQKTFREDLFYRLNVISIRIPPLRERIDDIPLLVQHFLAEYGDGLKKVSPVAMNALRSFAWPGNVRQLENEIRRALVLSDGVIEREHLSPSVTDGNDGSAPDGLNVRGRVDRLEVELLQTALARTGGNQTRAAELLGVSRFGLQKMMKRLKIAPTSARGGRRSGGRVARSR